MVIPPNQPAMSDDVGVNNEGEIVDYQQFIQSKKHTLGDHGFDPVWMPDCVFDFQQHIITKAIRKGRMGVFADTGLGKTLLQLAIAENVVRKTNGRVLILTPLAVAFQFVDEASRIGVGDIAHSKDGTIKAKITVCNYERLHLLNPDDFECVMLDESSILKKLCRKNARSDRCVYQTRQVPFPVNGHTQPERLYRTWQ